MSFDTISKVFALDIKPATYKLVLLYFASCANKDTLEAFPSAASVCQMTGLDRKTVVAAIKELQKRDYLVDIQKRKGSTGQVRVFKITFPRAVERVPKTGPLNSPKNGTVIAFKEYRLYAERVPFFPSKGTVFTRKGTQKRDTESVRNKEWNKEVKRESVRAPEDGAEIETASLSKTSAEKSPTPTAFLNEALARRPNWTVEHAQAVYDKFIAHKPGKEADRGSWLTWVDNEKTNPAQATQFETASPRALNDFPDSVTYSEIKRRCESVGIQTTDRGIEIPGPFLKSKLHEYVQQQRQQEAA